MPRDVSLSDNKCWNGGHEWVKIARRCHYWEEGGGAGCTYGEWHPLASEKLLALTLNAADDASVFAKGYISLKGFS